MSVSLTLSPRHLGSIVKCSKEHIFFLRPVSRMHFVMCLFLITVVHTRALWLPLSSNLLSATHVLSAGQALPAHLNRLVSPLNVVRSALR